MKRILPAIAVAAICAAAFTGCNNKPPFEKLNAAVDSVNIEMQAERLTWCDSVSVKYDEITNTVKYTFVVPGMVDKDMVAEGASVFEDAFIEGNLVQHNRYGIGTEIVDANANVLITLRGQKGGEFEMLIENSRIADSYKAAHADEKTR